jgi:lipopolysaccharide transport system ATP-binding protein
MESIVVNSVSKRYRIPHHKKTTVFQNLIGLISRQLTYEEFWALRDVSFEVERGQAFGIIGINGSGKSTLLKMLAKVLYPDSGSVVINGKIASFLELGVGFQHELTAKENVYIYSSVLGINRRQTEKIYEDILEFAELKKFEDMKTKNFSSGMLMRLAFSTAVHTNPDILLIDEVLAVGDELFQKKCMQKIHEFKQQDKTIIFVSHALDVVNQVCETAMLIDGGRVIALGPTAEVVEKYLYMLDSRNAPTADSSAGGSGKHAGSLPLHGAMAFPVSAKFEKIIGAGEGDSIDAICSANYFHLMSFTANETKNLHELLIRCVSPGYVKLAIYANDGGEPGLLINAVDIRIPVLSGWNAIPFPATAIVAGEQYWLAYCSNDNVVGAQKAASESNRRFKPVDFKAFSFPSPAGSDFIRDTTYCDLIAGRG